ncbi:uncharacterized protein J4E78_010872 [Alternaria triticimaculans]|uniref:uncharacterized protein n=1 Tax=Alternaria triticimaculans TaxID=297637 RepID=UPI0020C226A7|nr:uncharacterized protein J4E78_010872 [Alternaria triticimaculans]KAI4639545.1 hypothetical protein J4E78_010872 [Alternaria triticimaculans]
MTEAGHDQMKSSSTSSQSSAPLSFVPTNPNPIDTSSEARQHEETKVPSTDDRHDHDSRGTDIPAPEGDTSGTYTPSPLHMAMFVAVVVFFIIAVYQGILYIPGAQPSTAALASGMIWTAITLLQPYFLGNCIYYISYAMRSIAWVIESGIHDGYGYGPEIGESEFRGAAMDTLKQILMHVDELITVAKTNIGHSPEDMRVTNEADLTTPPADQVSLGEESGSNSSSRRRSSASSSPKPKPAVPKKSSRISNMKF